MLRAIARANQRAESAGAGSLPIPKWTPYELRHSAASAISVELGGEAATSQLGHMSQAAPTSSYPSFLKIVDIALVYPFRTFYPSALLERIKF